MDNFVIVNGKEYPVDITPVKDIIDNVINYPILASIGLKPVGLYFGKDSILPIYSMSKDAK